MSIEGLRALTSSGYFFRKNVSISSSEVFSCLSESNSFLWMFKKASFFAVLNRSGPVSQGILSFLSPGYTLALDFPYDEGNLQQLLQELDRVLLKHDGRLYMAKDATTTAEVFAEMYPGLRKFAAIKAKIDPNHRFASSQARRLGIVEAI